MNDYLIRSIAALAILILSNILNMRERSSLIKEFNKYSNERHNRLKQFIMFALLCFVPVVRWGVVLVDLYAGLRASTPSMREKYIEKVRRASDIKCIVDEVVDDAVDDIVSVLDEE